MKSSVCIKASAKDTWAILSDLEKIADWVEPVQSAHCPGDKSRGVGAKRVCLLNGNVEIFEEIVQWVENESFTYTGANIPLVETARNTWSVVAQGEHALVITESTLTLKYGIIGRLLEPLMKIMSSRMGANSLASLKYYIENGQPYTGKASKLPRAPISC